LIFFIFLFGLSACNHGIAPLEEPSVTPGFEGKVFFKGSWPTGQYSQIIVTLFKNPILDSTDFNLMNLRFVSKPVPDGVKEFKYSTKDKDNFLSNVEAGEYAYLAVAMQVRPNSFARRDWKIIGVYIPNGDSSKAGRIIIPPDTFLKDVNITCDFDHLPVQPPEGVAGK